jgi:hypothetical protein
MGTKEKKKSGSTILVWDFGTFGTFGTLICTWHSTYTLERRESCEIRGSKRNMATTNQDSQCPFKNVVF